MKKRAMFIVLLMVLSVVNIGISVSNASTIETIDINPSQTVDGKLIVSGDVNISIIDQGDSDHCELWIDGDLYTYMKNVSGTYDWSYEINTKGFADGAHTIQIRSIGGSGGDDIRAKQVWFDNTDPILKNKSVNYPIGYNAARENSSVYIKTEVTDDVSGIGSIFVNASEFGMGQLPMYDDGEHNDKAADDGIYCTQSFFVHGETSYKYLDIVVEDKSGNKLKDTVELVLDTTKPTIRNLKGELPAGQSSVKKGDQIRYVGNVTDLKLKYGSVSAKTPVDVALVIDTSQSMQGSALIDAKQAARTFIGKLNAEDRAALYIFDWENPQRKEDYMYMTEENKQSLNETIQNLSADDLTPIWDTIGEASNYAWNNHISDHTPAVVSMTDGDDTGRYSVYSVPEGGSEKYCPGVRGSNDYGSANKTWNMTGDLTWNEEKTYNWNIARYRGDSWDNIDLTDNRHDSTRFGLINSPVPNFNIGLDIGPQASNKSAEYYLDPNKSVNEVSGAPSYVKSSSYAYNFTTEYDLRAISNSTGGTYHYAPTSSQLIGIYENISKTIENIGKRWIGEEAPSGIKKVYLDASELNISSPIPMYDDGNHGDGNANDNIYGSDYFTVKSEKTKNATVEMIGVDHAGNTNQTYAFIDVDNSYPTLNDKIINYPNGQNLVTEGQNISFEVQVSDKGTSINQISLDTTSIGGTNNVILKDNGQGNDQYAGDNIYTSKDISVYTGGVTGTFSLDLTIDDNADNEILSTFEVVVDTIDNTPPSGSIANPSSEQIIEDSYEFKVNAWDNVGVSSVKIKINDKEYQAAYNQNLGYWTYTLDTTSYDDGEYDVSVDIEDVNGYLTEKGPLTLYIDNNGPSLSVNHPKEEDILIGETNISVNAQDELGISYMRYRVDNSESVDMSKVSGNWTSSLNTTQYSDGVHDIHFKVEDNAGHVKIVDVSVIFDNSQPDCNLKSPNKNEYIDDIYTFKVAASDEVGINNVVLNIDNNVDNWTYNMSYDASSGIWTYTLDTTIMNDGKYNTYTTVIDQAGHKYISNNVTFYIDNTAPTLSINNPQKDDILKDKTTLSVNSFDEVAIRYVRYWVDSSEKNDMTKSSENWVTTLDTAQFNDGNHVIHFKVEDYAGHVKTTKVEVIFDNTGPTSYIESPDAEEYIEESYTFRAVATDEVGVESVTLNIFVDTYQWNYTMVYNPDNGFWEKNIDTSSFSDSVFNANVTTVDEAGYSYTSNDMKFYIDNNAPTMNVITPKNNEIISGNYNITVSSDDKVDVSTVKYKIDNSVWKPLVYVPYSTGEYNWVTELNTSKLSDGPHNLKLKTIDKAGHENNKNFIITVDNNKPVGNITNPSKSEYIEGKYTFKVIAFDEVGIHHVKIDIEGGGYDQQHILQYNEDNGYWETLINTNTLPDGEKDVRLEILDLAGHRVIYNKKFYVDNNAPDVSIKDPNKDEIISKEYKLKVKSSDEVGIKYVGYQVDSSSWVQMEEKNDFWRADLNTSLLNNGEHTINIKSKDMAGHISRKQVKVTIDNDRPNISIVNPQKDQFIEDELKIQLDVNDNIGIEDVRVHVYSLISGDDYSSKWIKNATYNPSSGYHEVSIDTELENEGGYWKVSAQTTDLAGYSTTTKDIEFKVDNHYPSLTLNGPKDGEYIQGIVNFNFTAQDAFQTYTEYKVDDSGWVPAIVDLNTTKLKDGKHIIEFRSTDAAEKSVTQSIQVYVDNNDPKTEIASPIEGQFVDGWFKFRISAKDEVGLGDVKLRLFNKTRKISYDSSSGYYIYEVDTRSVKDGTYNAKAIVDDMIDNTNSTENIEFNVDNNKPQLDIISPENEDYINGSVSLNVTVEDEFLKDVKYTVDNTGFVPIEEKLNTTRLSEGKHTISVKAIDLNGHETISKLSVIVDNEAPKLRVLKPTPYEVVSGEQSIEVFAGQEIENMTLSMPKLDNGVPISMNKLPASESFRYILNTSRLTDSQGSGVYDGTITALDQAGHRRAKEFSIKVDNKGPHINKTKPDYAASKSIKFESIVDDWSEIETVEINIDGKGWNEMVYSGNETYKYVWETELDDNGNHTYTIRAIDQNGNVETFTSTVDVNNSRDYWTILQNNVPGLSFLMVLILLFFLMYLMREEISSRISREDDDGKDGGRTKKEKDDDLLSRLKFGNLYSSEKKKSDNEKDENRFGFLSSFGSKNKKEKPKKKLRKLKKLEKKDDHDSDKEDIEKFDVLELKKDIIKKLNKEDIQDIDDLSEYSINNLKKYTDLTDEEIQAIEEELEDKGYEIKEDKELMSSVIDAEL